MALVAATGCTTPPILTDIGNAVDDATKKVVNKANEVWDRRQGSLPPPVEGEEEAVKDAREAYNAGKLAYQTAQFIEAVERFLESFTLAEKIEDIDMRAQVQSSLFYNLGQAHIRAYELDGDRTRLTQAKALLTNHLESDPNLSEAERAHTQELIAQADATLAESEAKRADTDGSDDTDPPADSDGAKSE